MSELKEYLDKVLPSGRELYEIAEKNAKLKKQEEGLPIVGNGYIGNVIGGQTSGFLRGLGDMASFFGADSVGNKLNSGADWIEERLPEQMKAELSLDYLLSPNGLMRSTGQTMGSIASILAPTFLAPESLPATIGRGLMAIPKFGRLLAGQDALAGLATGTSAKLAARGMMGAFPESAMEGGSRKRLDLANGVDYDEATKRSWGVAARNLPFLIGSNAFQMGLLPKLLGKGRGKAALAELGIQAGEEGMQEGFQRAVTPDEKYSYNPIDWFTNKDYEAQKQAAVEGVAGMAIPILGGAIGGAVRDRRNKNNEQNENPSNENVFGVENYNMPTQSGRITEQVSHLKNGWQEILPQIGGALKDNFGINATISSAARTAEHNAEVGGVPTSHHIIRENGGDALDVVFDRDTTAEERQKIIDYFKGTGKFKEVIWHNVGSGYHLHLGGLIDGQAENSFNRGVYTGSDPNFSEKENRIWRMAQKASDYLYGKTGFNINPEMFYRQWIHETGNLSSELVEKDHNYGGLTWGKIPTKEELLEYDPNLENDADFMARGMEVFNQPENGGKGKYRHYKSDEDYYKSYIDDFIIPRINRGDLNSENVKTIEGYVNAMSNSGYFTSSPESYYHGMKDAKIPSTRGYSEDESEGETSEAPQFDLNATDSETKKIFEQFVRQKRDEMRATENETMFDGMFTPKDEFNNSDENRAIIANLFGEELQNFGNSKLTGENTTETTNPPKNQFESVSRPAENVPKPTEIKAETKNLDNAKNASKFFQNETFIQALKNLQRNAWNNNKNQLAMDAQEVIQSGNVAKMKKFLAKNGVDIESLVNETAQKSAEKATQKATQKMQDKIEKAMKPISENKIGRVAQGKIISDVAKANNVELSPTLETGLKSGSKKALETAQGQLENAGVFSLGKFERAIYPAGMLEGLQRSRKPLNVAEERKTSKGVISLLEDEKGETLRKARQAKQTGDYQNYVAEMGNFRTLEDKIYREQERLKKWQQTPTLEDEIAQAEANEQYDRLKNTLNGDEVSPNRQSKAEQAENARRAKQKDETAKRYRQAERVRTPEYTESNIELGQSRGEGRTYSDGYENEIYKNARLAEEKRLRDERNQAEIDKQYDRMMNNLNSDEVSEEVQESAEKNESAKRQEKENQRNKVIESLQNPLSFDDAAEQFSNDNRKNRKQKVLDADEQ